MKDSSLGGKTAREFPVVLRLTALTTPNFTDFELLEQYAALVEYVSCGVRLRVSLHYHLPVPQIPSMILQLIRAEGTDRELGCAGKECAESASAVDTRCWKISR